MSDILIGIHAGLGELGAFAFLWALVELIEPTKSRIRRAKIAALVGVVALFAAWLVGGYYYVNVYGADVKPVIKEGPMPWAHEIFMEVKEHTFLFLPFLSIFALALISNYQGELARNNKARMSVLLVCGLIVLIALSMAGMGYMISSGARSALEVGIR